MVWLNNRMSKPRFIELPGVAPIPILYEDRSVLAIDKPRGWMLVPFSWQKTNRNLQAALVSSITAGDYWARSRGLKFLRFVHRLDADTTGILLLAKSQGAVESFSELFESRRMEKRYLAVVSGVPRQTEWTCHWKLAPDPRKIGRMKVDARAGKEAETHFRVLQTLRGAESPLHGRASPSPFAKTPVSAQRSRPAETNLPRTLIEARPLTGRTHQIRVHLAESGCPCLGDELYGRADAWSLALRAMQLAYLDPFTRRRVEIRAPGETFAREYGFDISGA